MHGQSNIKLCFNAALQYPFPKIMKKNILRLSLSSHSDKLEENPMSAVRDSVFTISPPQQRSVSSVHE
jgi:hypothetical protein